MFLHEQIPINHVVLSVPWEVRIDGWINEWLDGWMDDDNDDINDILW